jgi:hypothetical protein
MKKQHHQQQHQHQQHHQHPKPKQKKPKQKKPKQRHATNTATFEDRELLIVTIAKPINIKNLLPDSMVTARAVVIHECHQSHSSQRKHKHKRKHNNNNLQKQLQSIVRWISSELQLQRIFFVGDSSSSSSSSLDASFCSSYEGNSPKRKNHNHKLLNHRFVRITMLLLASIRMIALYSDPFSYFYSNSNSNSNRNSRMYPDSHPNPNNANAGANAGSAVIDLDMDNLELDKPRETETYTVNTQDDTQQEKENVRDNNTVQMVAATSDQSAQLVVQEDGMKIRYDLDEWAALAYNKMDDRANASGKAMEMLAKSKHKFKFVMGLEGEDVDDTAEGHSRKFLLCFQPMGKKKTSRKNKHTASGTPIFGEDNRLRNTIKGDRARRIRREADYQRDKQEVLSSGFLSTNMGGEGRCIAVTLEEMREHDFHSDYGEALVYIRSTGSPYERELYL